MLHKMQQKTSLVSTMNPLQYVLLLIMLVDSGHVICISIPAIETSKVSGQADMINAGYEQCKPSNEVCSTNNDCCSNCCTSFTYSAMTCQDECPNNHNTKEREKETHGNVVWKSKQSKDDEKLNEDGGRIISRQHREEKNVTKSIEDMGKSHLNNFGLTVDDSVGRKTMEPKPNKDVGIRIDDESNTNSSESGTKTRENAGVGLSVIDINKGKDEDSGENENTDIGTSIIKLGEKVKQDESGESLNTDIGTAVIKIVEKSKNKLGERPLNENNKKGESNKDLGEGIIPIQAMKNEKSKVKDQQRFNNIKVLNNRTTVVPKQNFTKEYLKVVPFSKDTNTTNNKTKFTLNVGKESIMKNTSTKVEPTPCLGEKCDTSLAEDIKEIFTQKIPNLLSLNPAEVSSEDAKKPACRPAGSSCKHPSQCCSQCCAVSDGAFTCFEKGTDECQSWVPGNTLPKCKEPGETCETQDDCCLHKCSDCGHSSKCDNQEMNICRVEGKQGGPSVRTKLCKNLGDICAEASECCTQCCAVSDGVFKCFEGGTHECQPGDNVSNTTVSEVMQFVK